MGERLEGLAYWRELLRLIRTARDNPVVRLTAPWRERGFARWWFIAQIAGVPLLCLALLCMAAATFPISSLESEELARFAYPHAGQVILLFLGMTIIMPFNFIAARRFIGDPRRVEETLLTGMLPREVAFGMFFWPVVLLVPTVVFPIAMSFIGDQLLYGQIVGLGIPMEKLRPAWNEQFSTHAGRLLGTVIGTALSVRLILATRRSWLAIPAFWIFPAFYMIGPSAIAFLVAVYSGDDLDKLQGDWWTWSFVAGALLATILCMRDAGRGAGTLLSLAASPSSARQQMPLAQWLRSYWDGEVRRALAKRLVNSAPIFSFPAIVSTSVFFGSLLTAWRVEYTGNADEISDPWLFLNPFSLSFALSATSAVLVGCRLRAGAWSPVPLRSMRYLGRLLFPANAALVISCLIALKWDKGGTLWDWTAGEVLVLLLGGTAATGTVLLANNLLIGWAASTRRASLMLVLIPLGFLFLWIQWVFSRTLEDWWSIDSLFVHWPHSPPVHSALLSAVWAAVLWLSPWSLGAIHRCAMRGAASADHGTP